MYLMKCGHAANAERIGKDGTRTPSCVICNCADVERECKGTDGLEGRQAICTGHKGGKPTPIQSKWELPFFEYRPSQQYDAYYCGCWGWD